METTTSIRRFTGVINGYVVTYWVGMALPADHDADDYTMVEVTGRYVTKRALLAAIENGSAWLS